MNDSQDLALPGLIHDLNNVFQTLVDAADRLSQDEQWHPLSAAILRSVERGRRISLGLHAQNSAAVPFEAILASAMSFVEDAVLVRGANRIRFECHSDPEIRLAGNWAWERVLINLFLNSMRAMPHGGSIQVNARRTGREISIVVRDTGCGIAPEILDCVFDPQTSTRSGGGLGLHVVKTIVHQDGGTVQAANRTDGPGAEFIIRVPAPSGAFSARAPR